MSAELPAEVEALRKVPFFRDLTSDDLGRLATVGRPRAYEAGEDIVRKGDVEGGLFVILSGSATVETGGAVHTLGAGAFFGEMALLADTPRTATVTAAERVEAMSFEAMYFKPFLIKNPSVAVAILDGVAARLREVQDRIDQARQEG
jgi:CRP/FNR family cyclic AMP-dependent transcriptional regulator